MRGKDIQCIQIHQRVYLNKCRAASAKAGQGLPTLFPPYDEHPHEHS